ncbi:MAG: glycosyltransferase family 2 protein, partial [Paracoccaceae bacterium]|nr:glycosyltransferase family 2 protein [Paracoccaceae bacterium]
MIELSIIAPVLNEVEAINPFLDRLNEVLPAATESFEVIFVDDGSSDGTTQKILDRRATDDRVKLLRLSRNYGKEVALTAGLDCAAGAAAVPMDVDLQDPPELIPEMMAKWRAGADIVLARRISRNDD